MRTGRKGFRRVVAWVCSLALCASMMPAAVFAEGPETTPEPTPVVETNVSEEPSPAPSEEPTAPPAGTPAPSEEPETTPEPTPVVTGTPEPSESPEPGMEPTEEPTPSEEPEDEPSPEPSETPTPTETPVLNEEPLAAAFSLAEPGDDGIVTHTAVEITAAGGELTTGSYVLNGDVTLETDLTIPSGAAVTIDLNGYTLTGSGKGSVITIYGDLTVTGPGVITGGTGYKNGSALGTDLFYGGGIYVVNGSLTMEAVTVSGNSVQNGGGAGIYAQGASFVSLTACIIENNTATNTTAIPGNGSGGGIATADVESVMLNSCIIRNNTAAGSGGGATFGSMYKPAANCKVTLTNCTLQGNNAGNYGGGITFQNLKSCTVSGGSITGNRAAEGGGVASVMTAFTLDGNGVIAANTATTGGNDIHFLYEMSGITGSGALTLPNPSTFGIAGINKWYNDAPGDRFDADSIAVEGGITDVTENTWLCAGQVYTVTFDPDGGSAVNPALVVHDGTVAEPAEPTREKYIFKGWMLNDKLFDFNTPITADTTLVADWERDYDNYPVYTLTFDTNGGSEIAQQTGLEAGDTVALPTGDEAPTKADCVFAGWYDNAGLTGDPITEIVMNGNKTVYAAWKQQFTLTFDTNEGSEIDAETYTEGETADLTGKTPARSGYAFTGWYENAACEGDPITAIVMDGDKTVYAGWQEVNEPGLTFVFDTRGGTPAPEPIFVPYSALGLAPGMTEEELDDALGDTLILKFYDYMARFPLEEPELDGYEFLFWSIDYYGMLETSLDAMPDCAYKNEQKEEIEAAAAEIDEIIEIYREILATGMSEGEVLSEEELEEIRLALRLFLSYDHAGLYACASELDKEDFLTPNGIQMEEILESLGGEILILPDHYLAYLPVVFASDNTDDTDMIDAFLSQSQVHYVTAEYTKDGEVAFWEDDIPDPTEDEVKQLLDGEILTTCGQHTGKDVTGGLLGEAGVDYTITHEQTSAVATVTVAAPQLYADAYAQANGLGKHNYASADPADLTIRLLYVEGEGWKIHPDTGATALTIRVADAPATGSDDSHHHDYTWQHSPDEHWQYCDACGSAISNGPHTFQWKDGYQECTVCGYRVTAAQSGTTAASNAAPAAAAANVPGNAAAPAAVSGAIPQTGDEMPVGALTALAAAAAAAFVALLVVCKRRHGKD